MLNCDKCNKWFHNECVGIDNIKLKLYDNKDWICNKCGGNNKYNFE